MKLLEVLAGLAIVGVSSFLIGNKAVSVVNATQRQLEQVPVVVENKAETPVVKYKDLDTSGSTKIFLTSEVEVSSANEVIDEIKDANKHKPNMPIYLLLDSPGGSVLDGARIISAMQASNAPVYTVCLQICASMAAMILEYGKERYAVDRSIIMFHPASIGSTFMGELDQLVSRYTFLQRYVDKMNVYTATRAGETYESFKLKASKEFWVDAEDALNAKYIDSVVTIDVDPDAILDFEKNHMRQNLELSW